jgi:hypothetical protein
MEECKKLTTQKDLKKRAQRVGKLHLGWRKRENYNPLLYPRHSKLQSFSCWSARNCKIATTASNE